MLQRVGRGPEKEASEGRYGRKRSHVNEFAGGSWPRAKGGSASASNSCSIWEATMTSFDMVLCLVAAVGFAAMFVGYLLGIVAMSAISDLGILALGFAIGTNYGRKNPS
jgi:hypothetical protein